MEEEFHAFLRNTSALALLLGGGVDPLKARIDWGKRPQAGALPAITLSLVSGPLTYTLRGRDNLIGYLVQMDCWAANYKSAAELRRAVITALDAPATGSLRAFRIEDVSSDLDGGDSGAKDIYRARLDVRVWHKPNA